MTMTYVLLTLAGSVLGVIGTISAIVLNPVMQVWAKKRMSKTDVDTAVAMTAVHATSDPQQAAMTLVNSLASEASALRKQLADAVDKASDQAALSNDECRKCRNEYTGVMRTVDQNLVVLVENQRAIGELLRASTTEAVAGRGKIYEVFGRANKEIVDHVDALAEKMVDHMAGLNSRLSTISGKLGVGG